MPDSKPRLTKEEADARKQRYQNARASHAIEGIHPTAEQEALFEMFHRERLSDEECREILIKRAKTLAAKQP